MLLHDGILITLVNIFFSPTLLFILLGLVGSMSSEHFEIKIGEEVFKAHKLSGYRLLKTIGRENADAADMYRDLILACVKEPQLSREEVEEMDPKTFLKLGLELLKVHQVDLTDFRELIISEEK